MCCVQNLASSLPTHTVLVFPTFLILNSWFLGSLTLMCLVGFGCVRPFHSQLFFHFQFGTLLFVLPITYIVMYSTPFSLSPYPLPVLCRIPLWIIIWPLLTPQITGWTHTQNAVLFCQTGKHIWMLEKHDDLFVKMNIVCLFVYENQNEYVTVSISSVRLMWWRVH